MVGYVHGFPGHFDEPDFDIVRRGHESDPRIVGFVAGDGDIFDLAHDRDAAIAALHAEPQRPEDADWEQIERLYKELNRMQPSPVVELNRAVAVAMIYGPEAGLALIGTIDPDGLLDQYHLLHAARADLLRRAERHEEAAGAYRRALELSTNPTETRYLWRRLREVTAN